ncbi:MAG: porin family protein [Hyphomicrobiales bacterium]|nr:porin family protein [Hyphomicrobiales bacterium]MDB5595051.1 porin family protein [Hyphomicrobiales bacterium]
MKRAFALALAAAAPSAAFAQQSSTPAFVASERWTGVYVGAGAGVGFGGSTPDILYGQGAPGFANNVFRGPGFFQALQEFQTAKAPCADFDCEIVRPRTILANPAPGWPGGSGSGKTDFAATIALGYSKQWGNLVLGAEFDVSFLNNRARSHWSATGRDTFSVEVLGERPPAGAAPAAPPAPVLIDGLGNYNAYTTAGYACTATVWPPNNRWSCVPGANPAPPPPPPGPGSLTEGAYTLATSLNVVAKTDWVSTLRARAGFAAGPLLIYGTGGFALGGVKMGVAASAVETVIVTTSTVPAPIDRYPPPSVTSSIRTTTTWTGQRDSTALGWALGAGAEWALDDNWSLKGEYVYYNLGTKGVTARGVSTTTGDGIMTPIVANAAPITVRQKFDGNLARVGVNYRFGGPAASVVASY